MRKPKNNSEGFSDALVEDDNKEVSLAHPNKIASESTAETPQPQKEIQAAIDSAPPTPTKPKSPTEEKPQSKQTVTPPKVDKEQPKNYILGNGKCSCGQKRITGLAGNAICLKQDKHCPFKH